MVPAPDIITCHKWGALPPRSKPIVVGRPVRGIFHHTDGHAGAKHGSLDNPFDDAVMYARALQIDMMDRRGWNDSGHNFLVMRTGLILQGRWGTVNAIEHGGMVISAHCPGENDQPGVEHEHFGTEVLTPEQIKSSAHLWAWICDRTGIHVGQYLPHSKFFPTSCPGIANLSRDEIIARATKILTEYRKPSGGGGIRLLAARRAVRSEIRRARG